MNQRSTREDETPNLASVFSDLSSPQPNSPSKSDDSNIMNVISNYEQELQQNLNDMTKGNSRNKLKRQHHHSSFPRTSLKQPSPELFTISEVDEESFPLSSNFQSVSDINPRNPDEMDFNESKFLEEELLNVPETLSLEEVHKGLLSDLNSLMASPTRKLKRSPNTSTHEVLSKANEDEDDLSDGSLLDLNSDEVPEVDDSNSDLSDSSTKQSKSKQDPEPEESKSFSYSSPSSSPSKSPSSSKTSIRMNSMKKPQLPPYSPPTQTKKSPEKSEATNMSSIFSGYHNSSFTDYDSFLNKNSKGSDFLPTITEDEELPTIQEDDEEGQTNPSSIVSDFQVASQETPEISSELSGIVSGMQIEMPSSSNDSQPIKPNKETNEVATDISLNEAFSKVDNVVEDKTEKNNFDELKSDFLQSFGDEDSIISRQISEASFRSDFADEQSINDFINESFSMERVPGKIKGNASIESNLEIESFTPMVEHVSEFNDAEERDYGIAESSIDFIESTIENTPSETKEKNDASIVENDFESSMYIDDPKSIISSPEKKFSDANIDEPSDFIDSMTQDFLSDASKDDAEMDTDISLEDAEDENGNEEIESSMFIEENAGSVAEIESEISLIENESKNFVEFDSNISIEEQTTKETAEIESDIILEEQTLKDNAEIDSEISIEEPATKETAEIESEISIEEPTTKETAEIDSEIYIEESTPKEKAEIDSEIFIEESNNKDTDSIIEFESNISLDELKSGKADDSDFYLEEPSIKNREIKYFEDSNISFQTDFDSEPQSFHDSDHQIKEQKQKNVDDLSFFIEENTNGEIESDLSDNDQDGKDDTIDSSIILEEPDSDESSKISPSDDVKDPIDDIKTSFITDFDEHSFSNQEIKRAEEPKSNESTDLDINEFIEFEEPKVTLKKRKTSKNKDKTRKDKAIILDENEFIEFEDIPITKIKKNIQLSKNDPNTMSNVSFLDVVVSESSDLLIEELTHNSDEISANDLSELIESVSFNEDNKTVIEPFESDIKIPGIPEALKPTPKQLEVEEKHRSVYVTPSSKKKLQKHVSINENVSSYGTPIPQKKNIKTREVADISPDLQRKITSREVVELSPKKVKKAKKKLHISRAHAFDYEKEESIEEIKMGDLSESAILPPQPKQRAPHIELSMTPVVVQRCETPRRKKKHYHLDHNQTMLTPKAVTFSAIHQDENMKAQTPQPKGKLQYRTSSMIQPPSMLIDQNYLNTIRSAQQSLDHIKQSIASSRHTRAMRESHLSSFKYTPNPFQ